MVHHIRYFWHRPPLSRAPYRVRKGKHVKTSVSWANAAKNVEIQVFSGNNRYGGQLPGAPQLFTELGLHINSWNTK